MLTYLVMFLVLIEMPMCQTMDIDSNGVVDEVVVTASRYAHEDVAWSGMMPEVVAAASRYHSRAEMGTIDEIVVNASRYAHEDIAWSGLMPEIICTASIDKTPQVVFESLKVIKKDENEWHYRQLIIETGGSHILMQLN